MIAPVFGEDYIYYTKTADKKSLWSGYDYTENPIFGIYKQFHLNNVLKIKGISCIFGFPVGKWNNYDDKGNIISYIDYDDGFDYTYEDVFSYCRAHNITLLKDEKPLKTTSIAKIISSNDYIWAISYYDYNSDLVRYIELDGKDGRIVKETTFGPIPRN